MLFTKTHEDLSSLSVRERLIESGSLMSSLGPGVHHSVTSAACISCEDRRIIKIVLKGSVVMPKWLSGNKGHVMPLC